SDTGRTSERDERNITILIDGGRGEREEGKQGTTYLRSYALRNPFANVTQQQARLPDVKATKVSRLNIHNQLHCFNLNANKLLQVTTLMPRHHRERLQWAQDQATCTMQQWSTLLFTDECWVTLHRNNGCQHCWRRVGFGGGGATVWAGITSQYIIKPIISLQFHQHNPNSLFMSDNAPPHHSRIVTAGLQEVGVSHMVWPAMYPDLNPIEHVWDQLKQRLEDGTPLNTLPQNNIMRLVRSTRLVIKKLYRKRSTSIILDSLFSLLNIIIFLISIPFI
uniref:Tc1-like transposase DDE domain-containing protein n=1 Tax=Oryzias latipes TaxID=8090 RepID=A0A3P9L9R8_ORYLA